MSDSCDGLSSHSNEDGEREIGHFRNHWKQRFTAPYVRMRGEWCSRTKSLVVRVYSVDTAKILPPLRKFRVGPILNNGKQLDGKNRHRAAVDGEALEFHKPDSVHLTVTRKVHGRLRKISAVVEWAEHNSDSLSTHSSSYV